MIRVSNLYLQKSQFSQVQAFPHCAMLTMSARTGHLFICWASQSLWKVVTWYICWMGIILFLSMQLVAQTSFYTPRPSQPLIGSVPPGRAGLCLLWVDNVKTPFFLFISSSLIIPLLWSPKYKLINDCEEQQGKVILWLHWSSQHWPPVTRRVDIKISKSHT